MNFGKIYLIKGICILLIIGATAISCSQTLDNGKMEIKTQYNFFDLYKTTLGGFNPGTGLKFTTFKISDNKTVFLGGSKDLYDFYKEPGDAAVLLISKDLGKSFDEIIFPEESVTYVSNSEKYSLIETNSGGISLTGKNVIYLLNNATLQYKKIDEYSSKSKIMYSQFNGEYAIYSNGTKSKLISLFNTEEYYLPEYLNNILYTLKKDNSIVYVLNNEIQEYIPKTEQRNVIKKLNINYDVLYYEDGEYTLGKFNLLKTGATIYDRNENELYVLNEKNVDYYRYKNFVCVVTQYMPKFTIKYSYDYGKNWKEYSTEDFFISSNPIGYFKDKYIVLDAGFYKKPNSNEVGQRIIIGELKN